MAGLDAAGGEVRRLAKGMRRALPALAVLAFWQCYSDQREYEDFSLDMAGDLRYAQYMKLGLGSVNMCEYCILFCYKYLWG